MHVDRRCMLDGIGPQHKLCKLNQTHTHTHISTVMNTNLSQMNHTVNLYYIYTIILSAKKILRNQKILGCITISSKLSQLKGNHNEYFKILMNMENGYFVLHNVKI